MLLPLFLLAIIPLTSAETYTLHHRFLPIPHDASSPAPPFNPRGTIDLLPTPPDALSAELSATFQPDDAAGGGGVDDGNGWYQVALQVRNEWLLASTRSVRRSSHPVEFGWTDEGLV